MDPKQPTCFTCGLAVDGEPRLNRLPNGAVCPTCRDRLLELLPPLFPGGEVVDPTAAVEGTGPRRKPEARGPRPLTPLRERGRRKRRDDGA